VIYTITSIPTVKGIRFYIQDQNGNRRQGGCATREKAEQVIARLDQYSLHGGKTPLPKVSSRVFPPLPSEGDGSLRN
jgi:hypothetical protein